MGSVGGGETVEVLDAAPPPEAQTKPRRDSAHRALDPLKGNAAEL